MALTEAQALELVNRVIRDAIREVIPTRSRTPVTRDEIEAVNDALGRRLQRLNLSPEDTKTVLIALVRDSIAAGHESPGDAIAQLLPHVVDDEGES